VQHSDNNWLKAFEGLSLHFRVIIKMGLMSFYAVYFDFCWLKIDSIASEFFIGFSV
jgi:hypothetical protein